MLDNETVDSKQIPKQILKQEFLKAFEYLGVVSSLVISGLNCGIDQWTCC